MRSASILPLVVFILLSGCYSFRGGSAPAHLRSIVIPAVDDASGSGRATMRQDLTQLLVRKFREDNSLRVTDDEGADSRLEVSIASVRDRERVIVSNVELETARQVVIDVRASLRDNVKKRPVFADRTFTTRKQYDLALGAAGEAEAISSALDELSTAILLESVAGW